MSYTQVSFEIDVPIKIGSSAFEGEVSGTAYMAKFVYGADADGNRGEDRFDMEDVDITSLSFETDQEVIRFIRPEEALNKDEILKLIFNYCIDEITS